jgi:hypothetical protein
MASNNSPTDADLRTMGWFALAAAVSIAIGSIGLAASGVPLGTWVRTPMTFGGGLLLSFALVRAGRTRGLAAGSIVLAVAGLAGTLLAPGQAGIHRWIDAGPLHVNIAAMLLPLAIVALGETAVPVFLVGTGAIAALLVAQPDASQATGFALAAALLCLGRRDLSPATTFGGLLGLAALTILAWLRPDPLQPVPEVEGVFALLASTSLPLAAAAAVSLAATALLPLRRKSPGRRMPSGAPLAAYFTAVSIMPLAGAYPVPLVGVGMSFPIGYLLGMALLCAPGQNDRFQG